MSANDNPGGTVEMIDERLCELIAHLHTASGTPPLRLADVSIEPALTRLRATAALLAVTYRVGIADRAAVRVADLTLRLAALVTVSRDCTATQLAELAATRLLPHLHDRLRLELDLWTQLMGMPRLVIELMKPADIADARTATLSP